MNRLRGAFVRVLGMFSRDRRAQAFAEEIESHLQMHIDDNVRSGMTRDQARREAILELAGSSRRRRRISTEPRCRSSITSRSTSDLLSVNS